VIVLKKYDWFKHGNHIRRRRARKQHVCSKCERIIKIREFYITITGLNADHRISGVVKVCLDCFYAKDWVDPLDYVISLVDRFEVYD